MRQKAIKEQVLISGKTVLSGEVERVLESHGSVTGAVVVSVPDEKHGEILKAFVTLDEGVPRTEALTEELAWLARTELGPEVVFKSIDFKGFLPHAEDKEALRSILWADAMDIPTRVSITVTD